MSKKKLKNILEDALLHDGDMRYILYKHELEELLTFLIRSMIRDNNGFIFAVTANSGFTAMVLILPTRHICEREGKGKTAGIWPNMYYENMKKLIPRFVQQLKKNDMPIFGINTIQRI